MRNPFSRSHVFDPVIRLFQAKDLLWAWTGRNIRARYQQSALGWLWAVIQPAAQAVIFTLIFTLFVPVNTGKTPYVVFSYVALAPWTFFAVSLADMSNSLVGNMTLVTKIYFPREALPIAAMLARLMDLGISAGLLIVMMLYVQSPVFLFGWLCVPAILAAQILLVMGLGLAAAAASVFYRDIQSLLALVIQLWFYACPIIYPVTLVPDRLRVFYYLNPMAGILEAYRDVLLNGRLPGIHLGMALVTSLCIFLAGYWFFKRVEFRFADVV
jgi:lipopolysaccharide transport system permease protein